MDDHDPGRHLVTHRAPPRLLEGAVERHRAARLHAPSRRPVPTFPLGLALLAATFLVGILVGRNSRPQVEADESAVPVRLIVHAPDAASAAIAGSWNHWDASTTPMQPIGDGLFQALVPLPPGEYEYMFVLDGRRWVTDPAAPLTRDDGFGHRNAVIEI